MEDNSLEGLDFQVDAKSVMSHMDDNMTEIQSVLSEPPEATAVPKSHIANLKKFLAHNRRNELPKPLKLLTFWTNFEEILHQLEPEKWTAASLRMMTKYFADKGKYHAIYFYTHILLPRVRDDIAEYKQLNTHIMEAMGEAQRRLKEFIVGFLQPWLSSEEFTNLEAKLLSSYLAKRSLAFKYMAPLLLLLTQMPFSIPRLLIMFTLLKKHYKFPQALIYAICQYYCSFTDKDDVREMCYTDHKHMPVIWFQSLLAFLEEYGERLTLNNLIELERLLQVHKHPEFSSVLFQRVQVLKSTAGAKASTASDNATMEISH